MNKLVICKSFQQSRKYLDGLNIGLWSRSYSNFQATHRYNNDKIIVRVVNRYEDVIVLAGMNFDSVEFLSFNFDDFNDVIRWIAMRVRTSSNMKIEYKVEPMSEPTHNYDVTYCPICKDKVFSRERRIMGNSVCVNDHTFPSWQEQTSRN